MRTFCVLIADFSIRTAYTHKWCWKKSSFSVCCVDGYGEQLYFRTDLEFTFVWALEFLKVQWLIIAKCRLDSKFQKFISPYVSGQISWLFFCFVDLVEENMKKIKSNFLEINFGGKKLPEATLYARTVFTRIMWVNVGVSHEIL